MKTALLVEDSKSLAPELASALRRNGYGVVIAGSLSGAQHSYDRRRFDLVLLDLMLPDGSGLDVLRLIRARGDRVPLIIITARDTSQECVEGLELGADDYITKPFGADELLARIRAVMRRSDAGQPHASVFATGTLRVDLTTEEVRVDGARCHLTKAEWSLICAFVKRPGEALPREWLVSSVLPGIDASDEALSAHVSRLRKKLAAEGWRIGTVWGVGYRFEPGEQHS